MNLLLQAIAVILLMVFGIALGIGLAISAGHPGPFRPWLEQHEMLPHHRTSDYPGGWQ